MNASRAYARMSGKIEDTEPNGEELEARAKAKEIINQQWKQWGLLPQTKTLIGYLESLELDFMVRARKVNDRKIRDDLLTKSITINEILNYVRNGN